MARHPDKSLERLQALEILFQAEATGRSVESILAGDYLVTDELFESDEASGELKAGERFVSVGPLRERASAMARGVAAHKEAIDGLIGRISVGWDVSRMPRTDRNLLRLALYELLLDKNAIPAVVINEAVLLAKTYGTDESAAFINGLLGTVASELSAGVDPLDFQAALTPAATPQDASHLSGSGTLV